jgi:uncharacterized membrane protein
MGNEDRGILVALGILVLVVLVVPVLAGGAMGPGLMGGGMMGPGMAGGGAMMTPGAGGPIGPGMMGGAGGGWTWGLGWLATLAFWGALLVGAVAAVRWLGAPGGQPRTPTAESPLDVLKRRYAAGAITEEQLNYMRQALEQ